jgi:uncharacterized protein YdhG (YjbR/CyaY superfamily)
MTPAKVAKRSTKGTTSKKFGGFSDDERAAMKERAEELKAEARRGAKADAESDLLAKVASMPEPDRAMAKRLHEIVKATAPTLTSRLWYGMPAYAKDGKVLCFYQAKSKFKTRYSTFGFTDIAQLDDGNMWPTYFGLKKLTGAEEAKIVALIKQATR